MPHQSGKPRRRSTMPANHETFAHGADVGVRGRGATMAEAFAETALALTSVVADPAAVRETSSVAVECCAADPELLLYRWLNALIFEMATQRLLFARYEVTIDGDRLSARAFGEPVDPGRHLPAVDVKGATFTELEVRREGDGWLAQCVVDV